MSTTRDLELLGVLDLTKLPYTDAAYVEMWDRVAAEWRETLRKGQGVRVESRTRKPPEDWQKLNAGVVTEHRDAAAAKVAGKLLRAVSLDPAFAYDLLRAWNQKFCDPPLSDMEVRDIFNRIARRQLEKETANV